MLSEGHALRYAKKANALAVKLADSLAALPGFKLLYPVQANEVFLQIPEASVKKLKEKGWQVYSFIGGGIRFVCSWQTTEKDVGDLLNDITAA
jgi:threonine aldolase